MGGISTRPVVSLHARLCAIAKTRAGERLMGLHRVAMKAKGQTPGRGLWPR